MCEFRPGVSGQMQQVLAASSLSLMMFPPSSPWLQDARQKFRSVLVEATVKLDELVKKIGKAVEDSKPYWEARRVARQVRWPADVSPATAPNCTWGSPLDFWIPHCRLDILVPCDMAMALYKDDYI